VLVEHRSISPLIWPIFLISDIAIMIFASAFIAPFSFCNYWIRRHFQPATGIVVQASFCPRRCVGVEGFLEDADDFGVLTIDNAQIAFIGDGGEFLIAPDTIETITGTNIGWRGFYLLAPRIVIHLKENAFPFKSVTFLERQSLTMIGNRQTTKRISEQLRILIAASQNTSVA
jgi:hypothetical protein